MTNTLKVTLRIPEELHARVAAQAKTDLRSLNGEMLYLLQVGLEATDQNDNSQALNR